MREGEGMRQPREPLLTMKPDLHRELSGDGTDRLSVRRARGTVDDVT
jgi:hypothetical protein